jgi:predicted O-methyltransferase YrrM
MAGRADVARLRASHPALVPQAVDLETARRALFTAYEEYVTEVSTPGMAASLETSAYLDWLCRALRAESILDLGSGFSSYVVRRYAAETPCAVTVTSVDDDPEWLLKTEAFLRRHSVPVDGMTEWSAHVTTPSGPHDVVFHDLASGLVREDAMQFAVSQVRRGGAIIFDDAQHDGHRHRMYAEASSAGVKLYSLRSLTLDTIKRWALLGICPSAA